MMSSVGDQRRGADAAASAEWSCGGRKRRFLGAILKLVTPERQLLAPEYRLLQERDGGRVANITFIKRQVLDSNNKSASGGMWSDEDTQELLSIRAEEEIMQQMTGTVRDATVYHNITKILASRGIKRSQQQVINKLKSLRKKFIKVHDHNRHKSGAKRMEWKFYEACYSIFGNSAITTPVSLSSSLAARSSEMAKNRDRSPTPPVVVSDETSDQEDSSMEMPSCLDLDSAQTPEASMPETGASQQTEYSQKSQTPEPLPAEDETPQTSQQSERPTLRQNVYNVPKRKKKVNKSEEMVRAMSSILMEQLRDMGQAMQIQEDQRQERFLAAEREMQQSFLNQISSMQERITRESQNVHMAFLERLMSRPPSQPGYNMPPQEQYSRGHSFYDPNAPATSVNIPNTEYSLYRTLS